MKLKAEQLETHLAQELAPVYMVSGDEPLLVQEACGAVRAAARRNGYTERAVFEADRSFDWNTLTQTACGMSLFAERRLIEVRLSTGRPGDAGAKALASYAAQPVEDNLLLVSAPRLDAAAQKTKWYKALTAAGVAVAVWPPDAGRLPAWIIQRARARGMEAGREAAAALAERVEGNLLACVQEIEKLYLLKGPGRLELNDVMGAVSDSTRFDVFALVDSALDGDAVRSARILRGLAGEGVEPALVLWALSREARTLAAMARELEGGAGVQAVLQTYRIWSRRQPAVRRALERHGAVQWWAVLRRAAYVDRITKGWTTGNAWDELLQLVLMMAGVRIRALRQQAGCR